MTTTNLERDLSHRFAVTINGTDVHGNALPSHRCRPLARADLEAVAAALEAAERVSSGCERINLERLAGTVRDMIASDVIAADDDDSYLGFPPGDVRRYDRNASRFPANAAA